MFDRKNGKGVTSITITKVRNGFVLDESGRIGSGSPFEPYVFQRLDSLYDYLVENDFEITEE